MVRKDNKTIPKVHVPTRLQRFLRTVARRDGISDVHIGAIIVHGPLVGLLDGCSIPSKDTKGDDMANVLETLVKELGLEDFASGRYLGWFDLEFASGPLIRQYNFEILLPEDFRLVSSRSRMPKNMVFVELEDILFRRLDTMDRRTARALASLLKSNQNE